MAERVLMNEYKTLSKETWTNISLINDNIFEWSVALMPLNPDSLYYGGYFKAIMKFPPNYPYAPPSFQFERPLWHPNIYVDGKLCISILHTPGEDIMSGEAAGERWSPVQRVESVLISVVSLLDDAETSSPANVDAGVMLRKDPEGYQERVKADRERSKEEEKMVDSFSWSDSEAEDDFGGSSDEEMFDEDEEGTDGDQDDD